MIDNREYELAYQRMVEEEKSVRSITLSLDLRQTRKPGTYAIQAEDKETSMVYTFTLNFNSEPYAWNRVETQEEKDRRIEKQRRTYRAKKYRILIDSFRCCASEGRSDLSEMARLGNVSARTIRRYIHEFSDEFRVKKDCVARLKGDANDDGIL